jgi:hypothetical protein
MADPTPPPPPAPAPADSGWLAKNWHYLVIILSNFAWAVGAVWMMTHGQGPPPPPPLVAENTDHATGWVDDPNAVETVLQTLPVRAFRATPAGQVDAVPDHVYLWEAPKKVRGSHIPTRDQGQIGSCVPFGAACAVEYLECVQIAAGQGAEFHDLSQEVIYGGSRIQIGGGRVRGDGSTGAWAAQWCQKYGVVARGRYGSIDLTSYSVARCRDYGNRGCPKELEPVARQSPVKQIAQVRNFDDVKKALASGYTVTVASSVGFGPTGGNVRDRDGFLKAAGVWEHQMCFIGYQTGARPGAYCMNSWGTTWVSGPTGPGDPPPGGFWIDARTVDRMTAEGDSWAYSDATGFPSRKLDWVIRAEPRRFGPADGLALRDVFKLLSP